MPALFIGLMSGTSLDGVDAVLVDFDIGPSGSVLGHVHRTFSETLRDELLALNRPGDDELHRAALAANAVALSYADAVAALKPPPGVRAIGAHGQTVRHRPREFDGTGYTVQLLNGALLAERTGLDVVCDFRSRDVAAGGEGAPLVPAFHAACFARPGEDVAVLNVGGIANLTLLPRDGAVRGFDCGPGNLLMDALARHLGLGAQDTDGAFAAQGRVHEALLASMLSDPFFARPPPKSTGRDLFGEPWLAAHRDAVAASPSQADLMATLAELTVRGAADALATHAPLTRTVIVCGGGAFNRHLMHRLAAALPAMQVLTSGQAGVPPDQVEAAAFAWLAKAHMDRSPGNLPAVTGARGLRVLGALYPGAARG